MLKKQAKTLWMIYEIYHQSFIISPYQFINKWWSIHNRTKQNCVHILWDVYPRCFIISPCLSIRYVKGRRELNEATNHVSEHCLAFPLKYSTWWQKITTTGYFEVQLAEVNRALCWLPGGVYSLIWYSYFVVCYTYLVCLAWRNV